MINLFIRSIGFIYVLAFGSLWLQIMGLYGSDGILPIAEYMEAARTQLEGNRYFVFPTVFWLGASDVVLHVVCALGIVFGLCVLAGFIPAIAMAILWFLYLSIVTVGRDFMSFQWDILLLETGFLTIFLSPWCWRLKTAQEKPSRIVLWLLRWLLFRLMFMSGMVKLLSGDETWRNLTAMTYHYMTQPIPNGLSWYVHHFPLWFHKFSTGMMFGIEIVVPFMIFLGRRMRRVAAVFLAGLQFLIILTGNYAFFNLLTIVLCLLIWESSSKPVSQTSGGETDSERRSDGYQPENIMGVVLKLKQLTVIILAVLVLINSTGVLTGMFFGPKKIPSIISKVRGSVQQFHWCSRYGLFANMTTKRPEVVIEGSDDGLEWKEYHFHWKAGNLKQRARQVAPHQPRLDWQMWFAALRGNYQGSSWFAPLVTRLLNNSESVTALLAENPFPDNPPQMIRARLYSYEFTTPEERKETGEWWTRKGRKLFLPVVSLNKP